ncbi:c-type cytochrome [Microvirga lotononidis]|uniref:Cytochrome c, mono-and diheme variants family n=1 Tax=Microvirga lotononidis TaxID=864069 RepID=I4YW61_9HYPH|nr:cytochrome c [Microvirga lotononidis]EIM28203.1 cytochrome c, mono- and diheme variants family [Microvirga lotononidis]WQO27698.1 cytochrome c [Microvirga lotononidis]
MRKALVGLLVLALVGALGFWGLTSPMAYDLIRGSDPAPSTTSGGSNRQPNLENGRTLFYAGGCTSCHAVPNQDDKLRLGGGYALKSPFGTFHVPNISPHKQDGIGSWTTADFVRAMREGTSPDGRHYYPAFPYTSYQRMSPEDLGDLFAFIMTLAPVEGRAPAHDLPFPYNIRRGVGLWKLAFLDGKVFQPDPSKPASWNRGAFLVNGPGHCAECHSERNAAGAIIEAKRFAGGPDPEGRGIVPNITPHPTGIGGWTADDLTTLLKTGETPNFDTVGGPMGAVVGNTAHLPDADRQAIAEYLLSLPPRPGFKKPE